MRGAAYGLDQRSYLMGLREQGRTLAELIGVLRFLAGSFLAGGLGRGRLKLMAQYVAAHAPRDVDRPWWR